jgi:hypothetical protein
MLTFQKTRLSADQLQTLSPALEALRTLSGKPFCFSRVLFGRYIVAQSADLLAVVVSTNIRPPHTAIIAVDSDGMSLLPGYVDADTKRCELLFNATTPDDLARIRQLFGISQELRR